MSLKINALVALRKYEEESGRQLPDDDRRIREFVGRRFATATGRIYLCRGWQPPSDGLKNCGWFDMPCIDRPSASARWSGYALEMQVRRDGVLTEHSDPMIADLAKTLLVEAVSSELSEAASDHSENSFAQSHPDTDWDWVFHQTHRAQEDVCETIPDFFRGYDLDFSQWLPLCLVEAIILKVEAEWAGRLTVEELYEYSESAAHRLVLVALGRGVSPDDEPDVADFMSERGVSVPRHPNFDSAYNEAYEAISALAEAIEQAED